MFGTDRQLVLALARMADTVANASLIAVLALYIAGGASPWAGRDDPAGRRFLVTEALLTGVVLSVFGLLNGFGQPVTGRLSDRTGGGKL